MNLTELQESLTTTRDSIYMNTGWAGPSPPAVLRRINETLEEESRLGPGSMRWIDLAQEVAAGARRDIAALLNVGADEIVLTHSTREAVSIILYGMDWRADDELLICDLEHIALTIPAAALAERRGVRVVRPSIPCEAGQREILEIVTRALTPKTRLVALSHIQFSCGLRMPVEEIARVARERGVLFLIDGAQSVGQIPVDVASLSCDFYTISGQKWLLGPVSTGALYINRARRGEIEPLLTTHVVEAGRVDAGPPSVRFSLASNSPALIAGLAAAVRLAEEVGIEQIERRVMALAGQLRERLRSVPCTILSPLAADSASGLVTVSVEDWTPSELVRVLQTRFGIIARDVEHPDGVRFSVSHFNDENEVEAVAEALRQLVREGAPRA